MPRTVHSLNFSDVRDVPVWIYALVEPTTGVVRYVGKSECPRERLASHGACSGARHVREWIESLARRGLAPLLVILHEVPPGENATVWERNAIAEQMWISPGLLNEIVPGFDERRFRRRRAYAWEKVNPYRPSAGREALCDWIREGYPGRSPLAIADAIGVNGGSVRGWLMGHAKPRPPHREQIDELTRGEVAVPEWDRLPAVRALKSA